MQSTSFHKVAEVPKPPKVTPRTWISSGTAATFDDFREPFAHKKESQEGDQQLNPLQQEHPNPLEKARRAGHREQQQQAPVSSSSHPSSKSVSSITVKLERSRPFGSDVEHEAKWTQQKEASALEMGAAKGRGLGRPNLFTFGGSTGAPFKLDSADDQHTILKRLKATKTREKRKLEAEWRELSAECGEVENSLEGLLKELAVAVEHSKAISSSGSSNTSGSGSYDPSNRRQGAYMRKAELLRAQKAAKDAVLRLEKDTVAAEKKLAVLKGHQAVSASNLDSVSAELRSLKGASGMEKEDSARRQAHASMEFAVECASEVEKAKAEFESASFALAEAESVVVKLKNQENNGQQEISKAERMRRGHALREANALVKKLSDSSSVYNVATVNLAKRRAKLKQAKGAEVKADRRLAKIVLAREEKEAKRGGCEKSEDEDESEDGESSDDFISDEDLGGDEIDATGARKEDNQEQEKELERAKANKYRKQGKNALMSSFNGRNGHHVFASDLPEYGAGKDPKQQRYTKQVHGGTKGHSKGVYAEHTDKQGGDVPSNKIAYVPPWQQDVFNKGFKAEKFVRAQGGMKGATLLLERTSGGRVVPPWRLHEDYPEYSQESEDNDAKVDHSIDGKNGGNDNKAGGGNGNATKMSEAATSEKGRDYRGVSRNRGTANSNGNNDSNGNVSTSHPSSSFAEKPPPFVPPERFLEELVDDRGFANTGKEYPLNNTPPWLDDNRPLRPMHPRKLKERHEREAASLPTGETASAATTSENISDSHPHEGDGGKNDQVGNEDNNDAEKRKDEEEWQQKQLKKGFKAKNALMTSFNGRNGHHPFASDEAEYGAGWGREANKRLAEQQAKFGHVAASADGLTASSGGRILIAAKKEQEKKEQEKQSGAVTADGRTASFGGRILIAANQDQEQEKQKQLDRQKPDGVSKLFHDDAYETKAANALMKSFNGPNGHHPFASDLPEYGGGVKNPKYTRQKQGGLKGTSKDSGLIGTKLEYAPPWQQDVFNKGFKAEMFVRTQGGMKGATLLIDGKKEAVLPFATHDQLDEDNRSRKEKYKELKLQGRLQGDANGRDQAPLGEEEVAKKAEEAVVDAKKEGCFTSTTKFGRSPFALDYAHLNLQPKKAEAPKTRLATTVAVDTVAADKAAADTATLTPSVQPGLTTEEAAAGTNFSGERSHESGAGSSETGSGGDNKQTGAATSAPAESLPPPPLAPPKAVNGPKVLVCAVARYSLRTARKGELKFVAGDEIKVMSSSVMSTGWGKGELKGETGLFPLNYCRLVYA